MSANKSNTQDLTTGSVIRGLILFALPLLGMLFHHFRSASGMALIYPITWNFASLGFTAYYLQNRSRFT